MTPFIQAKSQIFTKKRNTKLIKKRYFPYKNGLHVIKLTKIVNIENPQKNNRDTQNNLSMKRNQMHTATMPFSSYLPVCMYCLVCLPVSVSVHTRTVTHRFNKLWYINLFVKDWTNRLSLMLRLLIMVNTYVLFSKVGISILVIMKKVKIIKEKRTFIDTNTKRPRSYYPSKIFLLASLSVCLFRFWFHFSYYFNYGCRM